MIDRVALLSSARGLVSMLVDDLRARADDVGEVGGVLRGEFARAEAAGRTQRAYEDWREDLLAQVSVGWVLASVFVRFCEDNGLMDAPLLSGPESRRDIARDHRAGWLGQNPALGDREWLIEVFDRFGAIDATAELFGERNPLRLFGPSADGARALLELWWKVGDDGQLVHDFTDASWDTRFLGDLYQDLSDHAKKSFALIQTPHYVEEFILDRTLGPALDTFGLEQTRIIDPTCGSGHFLLGGFDRLLELWSQREPSTSARVLAQNTLDAVAGVDINPFAVSIARFRLLLAAMKSSGITRLADAPGFKINVAVGDSLLHGTYGQTTLFKDGTDPLDTHRYPNEDGELAATLLTRGRYHAVVGNPPYITVSDPALSAAYRDRYPTCHRQYSLGVPFTELFFALAQRGSKDNAAGYVGMITADSFMKREFGKKLIEEFFASRVELTHIIDTSGVPIFPTFNNLKTVILFGINSAPNSRTVRVLSADQGEAHSASSGYTSEAWRAIVLAADRPNQVSGYVSVEEADRSRYLRHPWNLQSGKASGALEAIERDSITLESFALPAGYFGITSADAVMSRPRIAREAQDVELPLFRSISRGEDCRDWTAASDAVVFFPYTSSKLVSFDELGPLSRSFWPHRTSLWSRRTFAGNSYREDNVPWWSWHQISAERSAAQTLLVFASIATHNHFVLHKGQNAFKQSAPAFILKESATEDDYLGLLGLLNSSAACFWMRSVMHAHRGAVENWDNFIAFDGTKLKRFPLPSGRPLERARALDGLATALSEALPGAVAQSGAPTRGALDESRDAVGSLRARMVALQEELDWECYHLYGLTDEDITLPVEELPELARGERAFEIVLARMMAAGEVETSWFERHGSTPITELPGYWSATYRELVERRIDLIESDSTIELLERPEYKRRWNWDEFNSLAKDALRSWLLDRLEEPDLWSSTTVTTSAGLAGQLSSDSEFGEVARLYAGSMDADLTDVISNLVVDEAVPYLAAHRLKPSGLRKRRIWEAVWDQQRLEDAIDAHTTLPGDHPDHLDASETDAAKAEQVGKIPVPPIFASTDFTKPTYWRLRGKLDVPKERFILLPNTQIGADTTPVIGWAGWDHLQRAQALSSHYVRRKDDGAEAGELLTLLAGIAEIVPWLKQWHNDIDPTYGERMGDFFDTFAETEARTHNHTRTDLNTWTPPAQFTPSRKKATR